MNNHDAINLLFQFMYYIDCKAVVNIYIKIPQAMMVCGIIGAWPYVSSCPCAIQPSVPAAPLVVSHLADSLDDIDFVWVVWSE